MCENCEAHRVWWMRPFIHSVHVLISVRCIYPQTGRICWFWVCLLHIGYFCHKNWRQHDMNERLLLILVFLSVCVYFPLRTTFLYFSFGENKLGLQWLHYTVAVTWNCSYPRLIMGHDDCLMYTTHRDGELFAPALLPLHQTVWLKIAWHFTRACKIAKIDKLHMMN